MCIHSLYRTAYSKQCITQYKTITEYKASSKYKTTPKGKEQLACTEQETWGEGGHRVGTEEKQLPIHPRKNTGHKKTLGLQGLVQNIKKEIKE